jgi:signal transduction histidine kinase/CheY-like chemotaxis protein
VSVRTQKRGRLFRKYVAFLLVVVALALIPNVLLDVWFSYQQMRTLLVRIQTEQVSSAADKIGQFVKEVEGQLSWVTQLSLADKSDDEWRFDAVRLLRQAPAVTELAQLDAQGRERYRMSRQAMDVIGSQADHSSDPMFAEAMSNKVYYGPVYFLHESEPYMTIALAGVRPDYGVIVAQVNLKFIGEVVSQIKVGQRGQAFVVDGRGRLIAHPDISLVLRKLDLSRLAPVQAAQSSTDVRATVKAANTVDFQGRQVLSAHASVAPLRWMVFAELPVDEAYAPLYSALIRSGLLLLSGLGVAVVAGLILARKMVVPIRTLQERAAQIGRGDLTQRIGIATGDELELLGEQFNRMAAQLEESHGTLEAKVEARTRELEIANLAKSRFLAVASHDLRQPLHALGLFVAQLRGRLKADQRERIVARIEVALSAMNELFNALLDISKLDAGVLAPKWTEFSVVQLLKHMETTFAESAREKGLSLRIVPCRLWVRSDYILLTRIMSNFIANAIRYTSSGKVLVGCRRHLGEVQIEVWDTGPGIPENQHRNIFNEFFRLGAADPDQRGGLGLGLAIVDRLGRLLKHSVAVSSEPGKGSRFSVTVPIVTATRETRETVSLLPPLQTTTIGKLVVVIDNDPLVLEGMGGLMQNWGCSVVTGDSEQATLAGLAAYHRQPDVIISDYHLSNGHTGIEAIAQLRRTLSAEIPAFLMTGDTDSESQRQAKDNGYIMLYKPVSPMALRATLTQILQRRNTVQAG